MQTQIIKIDPADIDDNLIFVAATAIQEGKLVAFPTETVYGLGCRIDSEEAINKIYRIKGREYSKPLGVYLKSADDVKEFVEKIPGSAEILMKRFLPGPITLILKDKEGKSLGFRIPSSKIAQKLISFSKTAIVATSANLSGRRSAKSAGEVLESLDGKIDLLIDGGATEYRIDSTVVDFTQDVPVVLRDGPISVSELERVLDVSIKKGF